MLARPSRRSTTRTSPSGTSGSRWFSLILLHERIRRRIWWCNFSTLINIVAETTIVSFRALPVRLTSQQSPRILCTRCLAPWFLTTAFFSKFPFLIPKFLFRISCSILLFTTAFNLWLSGPNCFRWVSKSYNSNTVLSFSDSRILIFYKPFKISSCRISSWTIKSPSQNESNSWISSFRRLIVNRSA